MAAPKFAPVGPIDTVRSYGSPDFVPEPWAAERPAEIEGRQPAGQFLGYQGPDQGYVLTLAKALRPRVQCSPSESVDDAILGCVNIALRRASLYGRAPVVHDLTIALTIWGWLDDGPSPDLIVARARIFEGVSNTNHHYSEGRVIADMVPAATLTMQPAAVQTAYAAGNWRELTGIDTYTTQPEHDS